MIPEHMLPHDVTIVHPATTVDAYGDVAYHYGQAAERVTIRGWIQQNTRTQVVADGQDALRSRWLLITNSTEPHRRDRAEWDSPTGQIVFSMDGPPKPTYSPSGLHHIEVALRVVD